MKGAAGCALIVVLWLLVGCGVERETGVVVPQPVATLRPTLPVPTAASPAEQPASNGPFDSGWHAVAPGTELRRMRVAVEGHPGLANLTMLRLDPAHVRFHVGYTPREPRSLGEWVEATSPLAAINGGFFTEGYESTALVVSGGGASGESYVGRGGMFAVTTDGTVVLRSLADEPYAPDEPLVEALQSWPMLVKPGGIAAYTEADTERDRRSVVARDRDGRVLFFVCSTSSFTLHGLSAWLAGSDLGIDAALNLDGGSSTGLYLSDEVRIDPLVKFPLVLLADRL